MLIDTVTIIAKKELMSISILQNTQGIVGYKLIKCEYPPKEVIFTICQKPHKMSCPSCKSTYFTATFVNYRSIKAVKMGIRNCTLKIKMYRIKCHACQAYRMEKIPFISDATSRISWALERTILELRTHMTIQAISQYLNLDWNTVKNVEKKYLQKKFKKIKFKNVKSIGIDEVFMGKTIGIKGYLTIVRDLKSGAVLSVTKGKKGDSLDAFAKKIKHSKAKIKFVAVDMAPSFTSWIKKHFPKAIIVYDHFHVIKLMNEKVNNVRNRVMNKLDENEKKELKGQRWNYLKNKEKLQDEAKKILEKCNSLHTEIGITYALKESLRDIYRTKNTSLHHVRSLFNRWCQIAIQSGIPELDSMGKTIIKHLDGILAFWKSGGLTSASMEGFNNKIGCLTRMAYGYRDEEYLILKIYDLPNRKLVKTLT